MFPWRWILPILQIAIASAAIVYAPYEYKARPHPIGDDTNLLGYRKAWPPPMLRMSYALNFPAHAAAFSVQFAHSLGIRFNWDTIPVIYRRDRPFIWVSVEDCMFLITVGALWFWLGEMLEGRARQGVRPKARVLAIIKSLTGCCCALAVAALATFYATLTNADLPLRQIGFFGLLWAASLSWYFGSHLIAALRTR
jgi:hypothetical protein